MKKIISVMLLGVLASTVTLAQQIRADITFSYFSPVAKDTPTTAPNIQVGNYKGYLLSTNFVSENPAVKAQVIRLLNNLRANGTGDINKCFIPRHAVTVMATDKVLYQVLLCFECDGIRFDDQKGSTKVKSVAKREKWMKELKELFVRYHFDEKGMPETD